MLAKNTGIKAWDGLATVAPLRFKRYELANHRRPINHYGRYLWNLALCREMYVAINVLEVALRSRIHQAMTLEYGKSKKQVD